MKLCNKVFESLRRTDNARIGGRPGQSNGPVRGSFIDGIKTSVIATENEPHQ